ncbi:hypothetical protein MVEN_00146500 [Mycena venus]|uniref:Uncharacterized protein n=1 Tax=Mycena venus TaxID=2733690 RepID=A0A8H7DAG1_9AGAR|nr:hypothetical protein MVEN_00146500 [Mycena venus]
MVFSHSYHYGTSTAPYRTPLSGAFWRLMKTVEGIWGRRRHIAKDPESNTSRNARGSSLIIEGTMQSPTLGTLWPSDEDNTGDTKCPASHTTPEPGPIQDETMLDATARTATENSTERTERDQKALFWTLKSLSDDAELEPFVEGIPDLLWGPSQRRHAYEQSILRLVHHPDAQLHKRIINLLGSCESGLLSLKDNERRRITCYKALWAVGSLAKRTYPTKPSALAVDFVHAYDSGALTKVATNLTVSAVVLSNAVWAAPCYPRLWEDIVGFTQSFDECSAPIDFTHIYPQFKLAGSDPVAPYALTASAMMQWSTFCASYRPLLAIRNTVDMYLDQIEGGGSPVQSYFGGINHRGNRLDTDVGGRK